MNGSRRDLTFISYSHKDQIWLDKLFDTLTPLVREGSVTPWADTQIKPGDQWRKEIQRALTEARVAVLLVSRNFLASDFISKYELPPLLKKANAGGLRVFWVHLSASLYEETEIEGYQAAHDIARPLDSLSDSEQAKVLVEIARKIRDAVARKEEGPSRDGTQEAIKGLRPFRHEDAEIFARLGRQREVEDRARTIGDPEFRFGVLSGESGCGKSSFLQAGLWSKLESYRVSHRCMYVKFTNEDPFETLKRAISQSLMIPVDELRQLDLLTVLQTAAQAEDKPLVLLFDQFEQFFLHRKLKQDREPFVRALTNWYRNGSDLPVKILVCIRDDFSDRLAELQQAMGYSIGPGQNFRLEKFEPQDAAEVIKQIAMVEGLPVEEHLVESMVKELAGREGGLISPAYLQIVAWVLSRQKDADKRAFTSKAFQKLGGVEGLLDRFLADALDARPSDSSKQTVLKILLVLIDLDRNARAGLMTVEALREKLKDTLDSEEIPAAVEWLVGPEVRLITAQKSQGKGERHEPSYELAHECLIPAVRKLAGKQLSEADRANQVLDRRVNEWLGNDQHSSYLLGWRDWRMIERNRPYLIWGVQRSQKEQLLGKTKQRWRRYHWIGAGVMLLLVGTASGWLSAWGQIQMVKWDLAKLSQDNDTETLRIISKGLASVMYFEEAMKVAGRIADSDAKARALRGWAQAAAQMANASKDVNLLNRATVVADNIERLDAKAQALSLVAMAAGQIGDSGKAFELLTQAIAVADQIKKPTDAKAEALSVVAQVAWQMGDNRKARELLSQALEEASSIFFPPARFRALGEVARSAAQMATTPPEIEELLMPAVEKASAEREYSDQNSALNAIIRSVTQVASATKNPDLLRWTERVAFGSGDSNSRAAALGPLAQAMAQVASATKNSMLLEHAESTAYRTHGPEQVQALCEVAQAEWQMGDSRKAGESLTQALERVPLLVSSDHSSQSLVEVAQAAAQMGNISKAHEVLHQAAAAADKIEHLETKAKSLGAVAKAVARVANTTRDTTLLGWAGEVAKEITVPTRKAEALAAVSCHAARLGYWREARGYAELNASYNGQAKVLIGILQVWHGQDKNCTAIDRTKDEWLTE